MDARKWGENRTHPEPPVRRSPTDQVKTSTEPLNHVGGRDHNPRELTVSEPRVEYKLARDLKPPGVLLSGQASGPQTPRIPPTYRRAQYRPIIIDAQRRRGPSSSHSRLWLRRKGGCLLSRKVRRCQDIGSHRRGRYVLIFVVALPWANDHAQSTPCSRSR